MSTSNGTPIRSHAFGLDLELGFDVPGLPRGRGGSGAPVRLELVSREEIDRDWPRTAAERIAKGRRFDGKLVSYIDGHPTAGFLFHAQGHGRFRASPDGGSVRCAPLRVPAWRWQRYLIGQVLPFVALMRGFEVFHASAVTLDGEAIAVVGHTGAGKTTLAVNLALQGARFLTDDVLAVDLDGDVVRAHPGAAIAKVRDPALERLPAETLAGLGRRIASVHGEARFEVERHGGPAPLRRVYFLDPSPDTDGLNVEQVSDRVFQLLLSSTFNFAVRTPERLARQLDVCARLYRSAALFRAIVPREAAGPELAAELAAHAARSPSPV